MKPQWQRARYVQKRGPYVHVGKLVWLKIHAPVMKASRDDPKPRLRYDSNIVENGRRCIVRADDVELLAQGPEDFADDVQSVEFNDWVDDETTATPKPREEEEDDYED